MDANIIAWAEIGEDLNWPDPVGARGRLLQLITALVKREFPVWITGEQLAMAMGLNKPAEVTSEQLLATVEQWKEKIRQSGASMAALSADSAGDKSGLEVWALAQTLGMDAHAGKEAVRAELRRIAAELWPGHEEEKAVKERLALVGLSALPVLTGAVASFADGQSPEDWMRQKIAGAISGNPKRHNGPGGFRQTENFWPAQTLTASLSTDEVLGLGVALLAAGGAIKLTALNADGATVTNAVNLASHPFIRKAIAYGSAMGVTDPFDAQAQYAATPEGSQLYIEYCEAVAGN